MIHVVFEQSNVEVLLKAFELDQFMQGDIVAIKDDYAVGPINNIYETEGYQQRRDWWNALLEHSPYKEPLDIADDKMTVHTLLKRLKDSFNSAHNHEKVWVWMAQNQHDVCGYYWLISQLKNYQGQIEVLYLNNLPFINEKGLIFYPQHLHEIQPKEFLKAKKLARPITPSEFEVDTDEWKKFCNENAMVRILEGGKKIVSKAADFYDNALLMHITNDFQKVNKVLHQALLKMKIRTGDVFLVWRINELIKAGELVAEGNWDKGWKEIAVKKAFSNSSYGEE